MRSPVALFVTLALSSACGGGSSEPTQLLAHGIVAGNNQVVTAGTARLGSAVVEQMVRNSNGTLSLRRVPDSWRDRALDLVVPRAFAQGTVVNGSPVVGAVVCAVNVTDASMTPFTPCTNTGADGKATFFFTPGTKAGDARAEIRGTVADAPMVFDTAKATVMPAAFASATIANGTSYPGRTGPATFPADIAVDRYGNPVPYRLVLLTQGYAQYDSAGQYIVRPGPTNYAHPMSDALGAVGARTIVVDSAGPKILGSSEPVVVRGLVQIVTADGVSATAVLVTQVTYGGTSVRTDYVGLHAQAGSCAIDSAACRY